MNCTACCPKGLDPAKAIVNLKKMIADGVENSNSSEDWKGKVAREMKKNVDRAGGLSYG